MFPYITKRTQDNNFQHVDINEPETTKNNLINAAHKFGFLPLKKEQHSLLYLFCVIIIDAINIKSAIIIKTNIEFAAISSIEFNFGKTQTPDSDELFANDILKGPNNGNNWWKICWDVRICSSAY